MVAESLSNASHGQLTKCVYNVGLSLQPGTGAGTALGLGAAAWDSALVLAAYIASLPAEALQGGCSCIKDSLLAKSRRLPSRPGPLLTDAFAHCRVCRADNCS